ncbi:MAG: response regulator transcription factor [Bacteroidota bacterium]|nr:DNA-binding response regulator [Odoribacter sp.]MDP3643630.1 response regulator transcription factor [Bacteroidota bacterium]
MNQLNTRILVVEDEPKVASFIKLGLEKNGFSCEIAYDGSIGKRMFDAGDYDLIILDVNIPYMNGIELCKEIRSSNQKIPVIMLTAMGTTEDKLLGFDSGADDYLVKPFEFRELLARIRSLLKRISIAETGGNILSFLDLEVNLNTYEVKRSGKKIDLTQKEFALLVYLLRNKGRVVSRIDIAEKVWDITFDTGTNVIDVYVNFLRKKIDKDFSPKLIHTQTGVGYILKAGKE